MLVGLVRPSAGQLWVLGRQVPRELPAVMPDLGAALGRTGFTPGFSVRRNLRLLAHAAGLPTRAVDRAVHEAGLDAVVGSRVGGLGPAQRTRLSLAAALLGSPRLLLLDEPTDGLDPDDAREVRSLLGRLGESGTTVVMSSTTLAEVHEVCHRVSVLGRGRLLASERVTDLVESSRAHVFSVGVADPSAAADVLARAHYRVRREGGRLTVEGAERSPQAGRVQPRLRTGEEISKVLAEHGIYPRDLSPVHVDLEEVYRSLTRQAAHRPSGRSRSGPGGTSDRGAA